MFPLQFVPITIYPGYVWNVEELQLYSYKSGILKKLTLNRPGTWNRKINEPYYSISHLGRRRYLRLSQLKKVLPNYEIHTVPVKSSQPIQLEIF